MALSVFREAPQPDNSRSFFTEWATVEGRKGNHAITVWLCLLSLADETAQKLPTTKDTIICFNEFGISCRHLFEDYNKVIFIQACGASAQLGFTLPNLSYENHRRLSLNQKIAHDNGVLKLKPFAAIQRIQEAAIVAYNQRETNLPEWILSPEELTFNGLKELLGLKLV